MWNWGWMYLVQRGGGGTENILIPLCQNYFPEFCKQFKLHFKFS